MGLEQTKGKFKLVGKVVGINNENAYREGITKNGEGSPFKSLAFFVQTSKENRVRVELFGMEREVVYAYSQKEKKSKSIAWNKRHDNHGTYKVIGVNSFLEGGSDGKKTRKVLVEFDAIDYILQHLKDGDVVRVTGSPDFQQFENQQGEVTQSTRFNINSITKLDEELDFEAEDFKEVSTFEQDIVVTDTMIDKEEQKLLINANIIKYDEEVVPASFVVDSTKYPKLANNMAKRLGFGDFIKVYGLIINATILVEVPQEDIADEDDWGGDEEIASEFENNLINQYISELQIISVDSKSYEKKKYNEDDFINEEEQAYDGEFGEEDEFSDEEEEELPFE